MRSAIGEVSIPGGLEEMMKYLKVLAILVMVLSLAAAAQTGARQQAWIIDTDVAIDDWGEI